MKRLCTKTFTATTTGETSEVKSMAVVKHTTADLDLMARLLRAEAEGEGQQGMLLVGNVGINRVMEKENS